VEVIDEAEMARRQRRAQILEMAKEWEPFTNNDEYRCPNAGYYGGF
jgi:hypothetical protein